MVAQYRIYIYYICYLYLLLIILYFCIMWVDVIDMGVWCRLIMIYLIFITFQVLNLVGKVNGAVVPIFSVLMTGKTEALYREVFRMLRVKMEGIKIAHIKTDFEKALMNAAKFEFPGVSVSGCWFHFCQSLFR